ncbi:MAG TPA: FxsA family protein [Actinomycetota bacterium]|jgi:UPF0716 protein FxsA|nr:FxsA family protein [Actinomycetota bacterium]
MIAFLLVLLIGIPILELYVILQVAHVIGLLPTLALLIAVSVMGAWLLKREGAAAWRRVREALARGEMPATQVADGALVVLGGALLLTPGFVTDAVGLLLLIPAVRVALRGGVRRLLWRWGRRRLRVVDTAGTVTRSVYTTRVDRGSVVTRPSDPLPPSRQTPPDGVDSPGRG